MSMNTFRLTGDLLHVVAICLLLQRLLQFQNAEGISLRSQELFLLVFVTRYLDLFTSFYSIYNSLMKVFFVLSTACIVYLIRSQARSGASFHVLRDLFGRANETNNNSYDETTNTYDQARDNFPHWRWLVVPSLILAVFTHFLGNGLAGFDVLELLWTFSICLESVTILPQLSLVQQCRELDKKVADAIFCLGSYRALYIGNWIYRSYTERNYKHHYLVYACGVVQTIMYADFFVSYAKSKIRGEETVSYTSLLLPRFHRHSEDDDDLRGEDSEGGFLLMQDDLEQEEEKEAEGDKSAPIEDMEATEDETDHSVQEMDDSIETVREIPIV